MAEVARYGGDITVLGAVVCQQLIVGDGVSFDNDQIAPAAGIEASKLQQQYVITEALTDHATSAAVVRKIVHGVVGLTGSLESFKAYASVAAVGGATVTVDLKKNGVSVLSSVITIDSGSGTSDVAGTITSVSVAAGDKISMEIASASAGGGTLPKGITGTLKIREKPD